MSNLLDELLQRVSTLERKSAQYIVEGVVCEVQPNPYRVRVNYGTEDEPLLTDFLPVAPMRAASACVWWPLDVGEAVTIISPSGVLERGRVIGVRYTDDYPPPCDDLDVIMFNFGDGGQFKYNRLTGEAHVNAMTSLVIKTPKVTLDSEVLITKNLTVTGQSSAADHLSDGVSGKGHDHEGDSGGKTKKPNK